MGKLLNGAAKGLKIASHVALGCLTFGLLTASKSLHPDPTTIPGQLWYMFGPAVSGGIIAAMFRWAQYDPSKVK